MSDSNKYKYWVYIVLISAVSVIFISRLFYLQILDESNYYKALAYGSNEITIYPARGTIYDRHGKLLVINDAQYDLMVIPEKAKDFDTTDLCRLLGIDKKEYLKRLKKAGTYNQRVPSVFYKNINPEQLGKLNESIFQFPAFFIETKVDRHYKIHGSAHTLGYMGELTERMLNRDDYYKPGDIKGMAGIEASYETFLRGKKGRRMVLVDNLSRHQGSFAEGKFDTLAIPGENLISTIDLDLQLYAEELLHNKIGSLVAIEPSTGEVLALVNTPSYDPNLLVGQYRSKNFNALLVDKRKPLFNRALKAHYPPGSTFKTVQALIGLQEGVLKPGTKYACYGAYHLGSLRVGCHAHPSPLNLQESITKSCNAYYCYVFRSIVDNPRYENAQIAYQKWIDYLHSFGIGVKTGIDLPQESSGNIPSVKHYQKIFGKNWKSSNIISLSIGQGEMGLTPLQMANVAAILANRGHYYTPHVVKGIGEDRVLEVKYKIRHSTKIDKHHFDTVILGMAGVCKPGGTASRTGIVGIEIAGKTGTAQNPHGEDHSVFICFAPVEDPKIAVAVIIENGGFGATYAAPIATLIVERYILGNIQTTRPDMLERMMNANLTGADIYANPSDSIMKIKPIPVIK